MVLWSRSIMQWQLAMEMYRVQPDTATVTATTTREIQNTMIRESWETSTICTNTRFLCTDNEVIVPCSALSLYKSQKERPHISFFLICSFSSSGSLWVSVCESIYKNTPRWTSLTRTLWHLWKRGLNTAAATATSTLILLRATSLSLVFRAKIVNELTERKERASKKT